MHKEKTYPGEHEEIVEEALWDEVQQKLMDFSLIFVPFGHYDEPEILRYAITSICPIGADVRQIPIL